MSSLQPILHGLLSLMLVNFLTTFCFYDFWDLLKSDEIRRARNVTPALEMLQREHL